MRTPNRARKCRKYQRAAVERWRLPPSLAANYLRTARGNADGSNTTRCDGLHSAAQPQIRGTHVREDLRGGDIHCIAQQVPSVRLQQSPFNDA